MLYLSKLHQTVTGSIQRTALYSVTDVLLEVLSIQKSASLKAVFTLGNIEMLVGRWVADLHQKVLYYQG